MAKSSSKTTVDSIQVECNRVNKQVNNKRIDFNIKSKDGASNGGNINLNVSTNNVKGIPGEYEPGEEYLVTIEKL